MKNKKMIIQSISFLLIKALSFMTIFILIAILWHILSIGVKNININFLLKYPENLGQEGGIFPVIMGTLYVSFISIIIAVPVGIMGGIYLAEYSSKNMFTNIIELSVDLLSGIPSIILGLFGFAFFVTLLGFRWSIISGALTLTIMVLPMIVKTTQDALNAVQISFKEASYALGATKYQTILKVSIPSALSGIVSGIILSFGRIIGETAAVILTVGSSLNIPRSIFEPTRVMSVHLYILASEGLSVKNAYATAALLIFIILFVNIIINVIEVKIIRK